jgi:hypothetical protein
MKPTAELPQSLKDAPWSVSWSGENAFRLQPSTEFPGHAELDQRSDPGAGAPQFALIHVTRQRRGMIDLLCHVCGEPTAEGDRHVFSVASGGMVTLHDGTEQWGCNVPPMHLACAQRALAECPHLSRLDDRPIRCDDEGRLIPRTDVTPGLERLAYEIPPGTKVVYSCYRLYGPAFTRTVMEARAAWEVEARAKRAADAGREP